jgi:hypothetical protein
MSANLFKRFQGLLSRAPLLVGTVTAVADGLAMVTLPGGGMVNARGTATVGDKVFVRDGVIEGPAPDLEVVEIEV